MIKRNLSGIYFRAENPDTGKMDNVVFEDLPVDHQRRVMEDRDPEWIMSLAIQLGDTIRALGDQFDIVVGNQED